MSNWLLFVSELGSGTNRNGNKSKGFQNKEEENCWVDKNVKKHDADNTLAIVKVGLAGLSHSDFKT